MISSSPRPAQFDGYASDYDETLAAGLAVSGESKEYFARERVERVAQWLHQRRPIGTILDFGCGTGTAAPLLMDRLSARRLIGIDPSIRSIEVARRQHPADAYTFATPDEYPASGEVDLAFCNGVFHHIRPSMRGSALDYIHAALVPGGLFAFWENNPLNPGTRYVMSRIAFDRDAITLTPWEARRLLMAHGFRILRTDFMFFFPRFLRVLRPIEPYASRVPLGAQYGILCESIQRQRLPMSNR